MEQGIACNTAEKPGATDKAMTELIDRAQTDVETLVKTHLPYNK
jgi:hypothetical protein